MNNLDFFRENLPILLPFVLLELLLMITAVWHVLKHPNYRFGNKAVWLLIVIVFQIIGPVFYFVFGRVDDL